MPVEQQQIIQWELDQTEHIVKEAPAESLGWTGHWLRVIKAAEDSGFHPSYPSKFGFGEVTSTRLISDVVDATASCGAVRHGAECFNFWFPQELDKDYLIVWDGFAEAGWTWRMISNDRVRYICELSRGGRGRESEGWGAVYNKDKE